MERFPNDIDDEKAIEKRYAIMERTFNLWFTKRRKIP